MINNLKEIYGWLGDSQSKDIFINRLNYNVTGDFKYISDYICFYKKIEPEYKLYIRHYSIYQSETILYAVV